MLSTELFTEGMNPYGVELTLVNLPEKLKRILLTSEDVRNPYSSLDKLGVGEVACPWLT